MILAKNQSKKFKGCLVLPTLTILAQLVESDYFSHVIHVTRLYVLLFLTQLTSEFACVSHYFSLGHSLHIKLSLC